MPTHLLAVQNRFICIVVQLNGTGVEADMPTSTFHKSATSAEPIVHVYGSMRFFQVVVRQTV